MILSKPKQLIQSISEARRNNKEKEKEFLFLAEERVLIYATVIAITNYPNIVVEGRIPYQIICQYVDHATMTIYQFKSEFLWYDPTPYLKRTDAPIYVDPRDFKEYEMDLESILS